MSSKSDAPALRLVVERGPKLAPASAFDAERLDTFKVGRVLRFTPVEEADRKDIRRWWAILNRAVKDTKTPWRTATQASEAIKLALGIVEYGKTVGGSFMQWPKSLKELDDEELAEAVRDMAALLHKMTGVDPLEWNKESADVGRDETEQPEEMPPTSGSEASGEPSSDPHNSAGLDQSAGAADQEDGSDANTDESSSDADRVRRLLMEECAENFIRDATSLPKEDRRAKIDKLLAIWKGELHTEQRFVDLCHRSAEKLIENPGNKPAAEKYLKGLVK